MQLPREDRLKLVTSCNTMQLQVRNDHANMVREKAQHKKKALIIMNKVLWQNSADDISCVHSDAGE